MAKTTKASGSVSIMAKNTRSSGSTTAKISKSNSMITAKAAESSPFPKKSRWTDVQRLFSFWGMPIQVKIGFCDLDNPLLGMVFI